MNLSLFAAEDFKLTEGDTYSVLINSHDQLALLRNPHCTKKLLNDGKTRLVPSVPYTRTGSRLLIPSSSSSSST